MKNRRKTSLLTILLPRTSLEYWSTVYHHYLEEARGGRSVNQRPSSLGILSTFPSYKPSNYASMFSWPNPEWKRNKEFPITTISKNKKEQLRKANFIETTSGWTWFMHTFLIIETFITGIWRKNLHIFFCQTWIRRNIKRVRDLGVFIARKLKKKKLVEIWD